MLEACFWLVQAVAADPFADYRQGAYEQALQGFLQMQLERPKDAAVSLHVGSAHYKLGQYDLAEKAFRAAASAAEAQARGEALYNAGNAAFAQGKIDQALADYQEALTYLPGDADARANLAFVRAQKQQRKQQAAQRRTQEKKDAAAQAQQQAAAQQQQQQQQATQGKKGGKQAQRGKPEAAPPSPAEPAEAGPRPSPGEGPGSAAAQAQRQAGHILDGMGERRPSHRSERPPQRRDNKDW